MVADGAEFSYYVGVVPSLNTMSLVPTDLATYTAQCLPIGMAYAITSPVPAEGEVAWATITAD